MEKVLDVENRISVLVGYNMPYASIKELVLRERNNESRIQAMDEAKPG
jgi:hypothetical protein